MTTTTTTDPADTTGTPAPAAAVSVTLNGTHTRILTRPDTKTSGALFAITTDAHWTITGTPEPIATNADDPTSARIQPTDLHARWENEALHYLHITGTRYTAKGTLGVKAATAIYKGNVADAPEWARAAVAGSAPFWTQANAAAYAAMLNEGDRTTLRVALRDADNAEGDADILAEVRNALREELLGQYPTEADMLADVVAVVFYAWDWEDGNFLHDTAHVFLRNGNRIDVEIPGAKDSLTDTYGRVGPNAALIVNPSTGALNFEDTLHLDMISLVELEEMAR